MQKFGIFSALIQELEQIYARLVLSVLHSRMTRYQQQARRALRDHASSIKLPLLACIESLAADARITSSVNSENPTNLLSSGSSANAATDTINTENIGELSKYFKARINGVELHPGIEVRLEQSTWEHMLAALRYAKQGNTQTAQLHAAIASSACQELSHYMQEKEYSDFIGEIDKHLQALMRHDQIVKH